MKKAFIIIVVFFVLLYSGLFAGEQENSGIVTRSGNSFYQGDIELSPNELKGILKDVPDAFKEFKIAEEYKAQANLFAMIGGFSIGWNLGEILAGKKNPTYALGALGIALMVPGTSAEKKANLHYKKALDIYNENVKPRISIPVSKMYKIFLKNGTIKNGKIVKYTDDYIVIELTDTWEKISQNDIELIKNDTEQQQTDKNIQEEELPKESVAVKPEISTKNVMEKPKARNICKIGYDFSGTHKVTFLGDSDSDNVQSNISISVESIKDVSKTTEIGIGMNFQVPRSIQGYNANFSFLPIYGLFRIHSDNISDYPYLVGQVGYDVVFMGDNQYKGVGTLNGDFYYGIGAGFVFTNNSQFEILYSVNRGSLNLSSYSYYYGYSNYRFDLEYSKITLSYGFKF